MISLKNILMWITLSLKSGKRNYTGSFRKKKRVLNFVSKKLYEPCVLFAITLESIL